MTTQRRTTILFTQYPVWLVLLSPFYKGESKFRKDKYHGRGGGRGEVGHEFRPNLNKWKENDHGWERLILLKWQYYPN